MKSYNIGEIVPIYFSTIVDGEGKTLVGGTAALRVKGGTSSPGTPSAITVDVNWTGQHFCEVDTAALAANTEFIVALSAGTADGVSLVGQTIGEFRTRSTTEKNAKTAADAFWDGANQFQGTLGVVTSTSVMNLGGGALASPGHYVGWGLLLLRKSDTSAAFDRRLIIGHTVNIMTSTVTVDRPFTQTPDAGTSYILIPPDSPFAQSLMFGTLERLTVDTTGFAGSTTTFQLTNTVDESLAYLSQGLYNTTTGETVFVTSYSYSSGKVRLTTSAMVGTPANGTVFLKLGRKL